MPFRQVVQRKVTYTEAKDTAKKQRIRSPYSLNLYHERMRGSRKVKKKGFGPEKKHQPVVQMDISQWKGKIEKKKTSL